MRLVVRHAHSGLHVIALLPGLRFRQARAARAQILQQLHNARAKAAAIGSGPSGQCFCQCAGRKVRGGAHGRPLLPARLHVFHKRAVARCVHIRHIGAHELVHHHGAFLHGHAAALQKGGGGAHADGKHYHIRRNGARAGGNAHGARRAADSLNTAARLHAHARLPQLPLHIFGHLRVKGVRHHLWRSVYHRHGKALRHQVFGSLQPDEAGAHHGGAAAAVRLHIGKQAHGVVRRAHAEHARQPGARHIGHDGLGARGNDEPVVAFFKRLPILSGCYRVGGGVHRRHLTARHHLGTRETRVFFRAVHDKLLPRANQPAHIVRQAAACVRDILPLCQYLHLCAAVFPLELCGRLGPRGNAAYH